MHPLLVLFTWQKHIRKERFFHTFLVAMDSHVLHSNLLLVAKLMHRQWYYAILIVMEGKPNS